MVVSGLVCLGDGQLRSDAARHFFPATFFCCTCGVKTDPCQMRRDIIHGKTLQGGGRGGKPQRQTHFTQSLTSSSSDFVDAPKRNVVHVKVSLKVITIPLPCCTAPTPTHTGLAPGRLRSLHVKPHCRTDRKPVQHCFGPVIGWSFRVADGDPSNHSGSLSAPANACQRDNNAKWRRRLRRVCRKCSDHTHVSYWVNGWKKSLLSSVPQ